ncbi:MAG: hypothetical protein JNK15_23730 [Planctomycetes bacterium]|nr:hypothetical protein [Planctomycetota bacterium]
MKQQIKEQFAEALRATGIDLATSATEVATYAAERGAHLTAAAAEPGFGEALDAEQDRVWMFAARRAVRSGDAGDARAAGLIRGVLIGLAGA